MYRIVQINHTNIHFIQNSQRFLCIITNYKVVTLVTKNLQKNYKIVITAIAGIGRRPKFPSYLYPICIYTYKGAAKGAAFKELHFKELHFKELRKQLEGAT